MCIYIYIYLYIYSICMHVYIYIYIYIYRYTNNLKYTYTYTSASRRARPVLCLGCGQMGSTQMGPPQKYWILTDWGKRHALALWEAKSRLNGSTQKITLSKNDKIAVTPLVLTPLVPFRVPRNFFREAPNSRGDGWRFLTVVLYFVFFSLFNYLYYLCLS